MGIKWGYECWTPEGKRHYAELQEDRDQTSYEYECAYDIVRAAMAIFEKPDLRTLKNAMYFAHCFLNEELDEMPEEVQELELDVWIAKQKEAEELEEQVRLDEEEAEREHQEEEERLEGASRSGGSPLA